MATIAEMFEELHAVQADSSTKIEAIAQTIATLQENPSPDGHVTVELQAALDRAKAINNQLAAILG